MKLRLNLKYTKKILRRLIKRLKFNKRFFKKDRKYFNFIRKLYFKLLHAYCRRVKRSQNKNYEEPQDFIEKDVSLTNTLSLLGLGLISSVFNKDTKVKSITVESIDTNPLNSNKVNIPPEKVNEKSQNNISTERFHIGMEPIQVKDTEDIKYSRVNYGYGVPTGAAFNNIMNVRPVKRKGEYVQDYYAGQSGIHHTKSGYFASFTDPFYSIKQAVTLLDRYKNNPQPFMQERINKYGKGKFTLLAMLSIYDTEETAMQYATLVAKIANLPNGVHTEIDLKDRETFIKVMGAMTKVESGTSLSREYLSEAYDAIYFNDRPPLQNILYSEPTVVYNNQSYSIIGSGMNNKNK